MKKTICKILCLVSGGVFLAVALHLGIAMIVTFFTPNTPSVGIIGGADGPTAIFLTSQLMPYPFIAAVALITCIVTGVILLLSRRKKD